MSGLSRKLSISLPAKLNQTGAWWGKTTGAWWGKQRRSKEVSGRGRNGNGGTRSGGGTQRKTKASQRPPESSAYLSVYQSLKQWRPRSCKSFKLSLEIKLAGFRLDLDFLSATFPDMMQKEVSSRRKIEIYW